MTTPIFPSVIGHNLLDGGTDAQDGNDYPGPLLQDYAAALVGAAGASPQRDVTYIGLLGDSHTHNGHYNSAVGALAGATWHDTDATDNITRAWGWSTWVGELSMQRVRVVKSWAMQTNGVLATGSNPAGYPLSRQITNMLSDPLFARVNRVALMIGTNDRVYSLPSWEAELRAQIGRIPRPIDLISIPPRADATNTTIGGDGMQAWAWYHNANAILSDVAARSGGKIRYINTRSMLNTPTTVPDVWATNHSYDNLHGTSVAAYKIADVYVNSLLPAISATGLDVWTSNSYAGSAGANNLIDQGFINPLFGTASGGTLNTGITGTGAAGLTISQIAGGAAAASVVSNGITGIGNMQRLAVTSSGNGDGVDVTGATMHAAGGTFLQPGDQAFAQALVTLNSGGIYPRNLFFRLQGYDGTTNWSALSHELNTTNEPIALPLTGTRSFLLRTPIFTAPDLPMSNLQIKFRPTFAGAGACTIDIGHFECRRFRGGGLY